MAKDAIDETHILKAEIADLRRENERLKRELEIYRNLAKTQQAIIE